MGVFGDNGSGKSGYGRLVRRVTRSGEPEEILRHATTPALCMACRPHSPTSALVHGMEQLRCV